MYILHATIWRVRLAAVYARPKKIIQKLIEYEFLVAFKIIIYILYEKQLTSIYKRKVKKISFAFLIISFYLRTIIFISMKGSVRGVFFSFIQLFATFKTILYFTFWTKLLNRIGYLVNSDYVRDFSFHNQPCLVGHANVNVNFHIIRVF